MSALDPAVRTYRAEKRAALKRGAVVITLRRTVTTTVVASGTPEYWRQRYLKDRTRILARKAAQRASSPAPSIVAARMRGAL